MIDSSRVLLKDDSSKLICKQGDTIIYWMNRDQRSVDNWALQYAYEKANQYKKNLAVIYVFDTCRKGLMLTRRSFEFIKGGLLEVEENLKSLNIPFCIGVGSTVDVLKDFFDLVNGAMLVTDFIPFEDNKQVRSAVSSRIGLEIQVVDAHNIVPCWITSDKEEYAARTIRPKINKKLNQYLTDIPVLKPYIDNNYKDLLYRFHENLLGMPIEESLFLYPDPTSLEMGRIDWASISQTIDIDESVKSNDNVIPGTAAGMEVFGDFVENKLMYYSEKRNDPNAKVQSNLSPYFHFGQVAPQRIAYEVSKYLRPSDNTEDFLEEMIIRRELSDNYCYYNKRYYSLEGGKTWAISTLEDHAGDVRLPLYGLETLENYMTDDLLWNAAQMELVHLGRIHGYMRMYWAKKILEWSPDPRTAFNWALYLNDKYALDGRDPNGYVGVAWSICGVHDRAWKERNIFGKIRYMNYNGCKRKFDIDQYVSTITEACKS